MTDKNIDKKVQNLINKVEKKKMSESKNDEPRTDSIVTSDVNWVKPFYLILAIVLFIAALGCGYFYSKDMNMIFAIATIACISGGIACIYGYKSKGVSNASHYIGKPKKEQVNSLNIYPDKIEFEEVYQPDGQPWKCRNDGRYYFVNIWEKPSFEKPNKCEPFMLPDQQYYEPNLFAERVLELPAHRRLFRKKNNLMNVVKIGALLLGMVIVWILIITTTGENSEETVWFINQAQNFI